MQKKRAYGKSKRTRRAYRKSKRAKIAYRKSKRAKIAYGTKSDLLGSRLKVPKRAKTLQNSKKWQMNIAIIWSDKKTRKMRMRAVDGTELSLEAVKMGKT